MGSVYGRVAVFMFFLSCRYQQKKEEEETDDLPLMQEMAQKKPRERTSQRHKATVPKSTPLLSKEEHPIKTHSTSTTQCVGKGNDIYTICAQKRDNI